MATTKRERQKAARREKLEQMQRQAKRRNNTRRAVIVGVVAIVVIGTGALLFSGKSSPTTTTTAASSATTTTSASTAPATIKPISNPSPAGKFGTAPTVVVPTTPPPTSLEVSNLITGTGAAAKSGDTLEVQYVLATYSTHKVIQSSWTAQPFSFKLGAGQVIPGWDQGMVGMRVGGRRELIIPPSLGYGANSPGAGIAKNDTLVFVVDLLKITP
ncbi:MAG: FKBP-type peptidyl-prolyl cis-trans isomerase [Acidimicrobiales bacterium]